MRKNILHATFATALLLGSIANADQIISLTKTEVKALNAALSAPDTIQALFKCKKNALALTNTGAKIKSGNLTGSTSFVLEVAANGQLRLGAVDYRRLPSGG